MTEFAALLDAVLTGRDGEFVELVLADWLDERDAPGTAIALRDPERKLARSFIATWPALLQIHAAAEAESRLETVANDMCDDWQEASRTARKSRKTSRKRSHAQSKSRELLDFRQVLESAREKTRRLVNQSLTGASELTKLFLEFGELTKLVPQTLVSAALAWYTAQDGLNKGSWSARRHALEASHHTLLELVRELRIWMTP